jgi:hypothetical protein
MLNPPPILAFFAQPWMLLWALAAAAPLLIHLLNRRRYREQPWAAMEYLLAAMRKNVRRVRIEQWLLLTLRMLLILVLVAAVADPVLQGLGLSHVAGVRTHRVLVLDGSYSMDYRPDDDTRFAHAKRAVAEIVNASPQGDGFTLVLMATPARTVVRTPAFDKAEFLEALEAVKLPHGGGDLPGALARAKELIESARRDERRLARDEVYFVSGLGRTSWASRDKAAVKRVREQAALLAADGSGLVLVDVGQRDEGNVAITGLTSPDRMATTRGETAFEARVQNFGGAAIPRQRVQFLVDGTLAGEQTVSVAAGGAAMAAFRYRFDAPGDHLVEARIAGDRLDVDNHRWLSIPVKDRLRVLCVDGRPASANGVGAADYLRVALAPSGEESQRERWIDVEIVTEATWLDADLEQYDCVFLAEVRQFTAAEARALRSYLESGGGLVTFLGPNVDVANYNERLTGANAVLPATLGEIIENQGQAIDPLGYRHAIVSPFRDQEQAGLLTTPVAKFIRLTPDKERGAQVVAAFSEGDPFIVEAPIGRGVSIVVATSAADRDWTLLPVWPSFVPLVQEMLVATLQSAGDDRNLLVGQPLGGPLANGASEAPIVVRLPDGSDVSVKPVISDQSARWQFADTFTSGLYRVEGAGPNTAAFAVNVDTAESDLTRVEEATLRNGLWSGVPFEFLEEGQTTDAAHAVAKGRGAAIHFGLLVAALGLMFTESTLAWYFGARQA